MSHRLGEQEMRQMIGNAYNVLTEFATHTTLWGAQDHKRISLMNKATTMLRKKPDIVSYIEI